MCRICSFSSFYGATVRCRSLSSKNLHIHSSRLIDRTLQYWNLSAESIQMFQCFFFRQPCPWIGVWEFFVRTLSTGAAVTCVMANWDFLSTGYWNLQTGIRTNLSTDQHASYTWKLDKKITPRQRAWKERIHDGSHPPASNVWWGTALEVPPLTLASSGHSTWGLPFLLTPL